MLVVVVSVIGITLEKAIMNRNLININPAAIRAMRLLRVVRGNYEIIDISKLTCNCCTHITYHNVVILQCFHVKKDCWLRAKIFL